jgi:hypothetical protein
MMELLSQMLLEGYGCTKDTAQARARARGKGHEGAPHRKTRQRHRPSFSFFSCCAPCCVARALTPVCVCRLRGAAAQARYWHSAAHSRGARRLDGVYDALP